MSIKLPLAHYSQSAIAAAIILIAGLLPLRLIEEANVGWRSVQWLHALVLVLVSLAFIWRAAGLSWLRQYAFPILFLLVAVPWPSRPELIAMRHLRRMVTAMTVEVIGFFGVPAIRHANLLEISSGVVDIDGACSGIRSLQTSLMVALLFGEMYRLRLRHRLALIPAGFLIAVLANVSRTSFLTWSAATQGFDRMRAWHDPAGIAVVVVVLGGVFLIAYFIGHPGRRIKSTERSGTGGPQANDELSEMGDQRRCMGERGVGGGSQTGAPLGIGWQWLTVAAIWLLFIEVATAVWFRMGDKRAQTNPEWSMQWPTNAANYKEIPLRELDLEILRYDTARNVSWQDETGNRWSFIALRWGPQNKHSFIGRGHTPDQCFRAAGWRLCGERDPVRLSVKNIDLPFRRYLFEVNGRTAYVFLALYEDCSPGGRQDVPLDYRLGRRLKAAWQGKRHHGLKKLEISIIGPTSSEEALAVLQKGLEKVIITAKAEG